MSLIAGGETGGLASRYAGRPPNPDVAETRA
jgi:hypothetical protein